MIAASTSPMSVNTAATFFSIMGCTMTAVHISCLLQHMDGVPASFLSLCHRRQQHDSTAATF
jgi:hypothetical protein